MRTRSTAVLAVAAALAALVGGPALQASAAGAGEGNQPPPPVTLDLAGAFTGTGTLSSECTIFHQVVHAGGDWTALGASAVTLDWCLADDTGGNHFPVYNGTFAITAADGSTLSGDMSGFVEANGLGPTFPLHFTLAVTGGTGRLAGATGSIAMEGAFGLGAFTVQGTVDGSVSVPPHTPVSADECRAGGWQHLIDGKDHPFHNENQCVHFAARHAPS